MSPAERLNFVSVPQTVNLVGNASPRRSRAHPSRSLFRDPRSVGAANVLSFEWLALRAFGTLCVGHASGWLAFTSIAAAQQYVRLFLWGRQSDRVYSQYRCVCVMCTV